MSPRSVVSQGPSSDDVPSGVVRGDHIPELDGLRGLAIAFVLIWHLFAIGIPYEPGSWSGWIAYLLRWSWSGVDLFFVLSGFLIGGILIDARESPRFFKAFYVRRAFRILPLYACVVVAYALLSTVVPGSPYLQKTGLFDEAWPVLPYALFGQNFWSASTGTWGPDWLSVTWSLAVEEQFYLILPMAIFFLSRRALTVCFICLVVSAPLLRSFVFDAPDEFFWRYMSLPCRFDALGLGVLVAIASRNAACYAHPYWNPGRPPPRISG